MILNAFLEIIHPKTYFLYDIKFLMTVEREYSRGFLLYAVSPYGSRAIA